MLSSLLFMSLRHWVVVVVVVVTSRGHVLAVWTRPDMRRERERERERGREGEREERN
jgi:hypothetical protein